MGRVVLEFCEVVKHFQGPGETIHAIDRVSLQVEPGELVALYGPSGSGKTTLLLIAAGLVHPDRGSVRFDDEVISDFTQDQAARFRLHKLGFVFQVPHLIAGAPAVDNAAIPLLLDGFSRTRARRAVTPLLEELGLGSRINHASERLSSGERQRVAIARALSREPQIMLADEPTGNLDTHRGDEVLAMFATLCRERKIATILVTHDPRAASYADRVYELRDGQLEEKPELEG
ncbi:MAG TPA: ABC transporter ATP-binding protein [Solirubrobacteraceae bacterium]|nr:ABC transporter ATP-binding protein [Solirubrobacteraceae bacterium]